jgi:hypothetical protein
MTTDPITIAKCPNCGSIALAREGDIDQFEKEIIFSYSCDCGCLFTERYIKSDTCVYVQGRDPLDKIRRK